MLNPNQAGFRKERCTTDQVLKLVQMASDKIHQNKEGSTTLVTFFDFSRAYDKVWREGLISKMIKMGVLFQFIKYTRLFLSGRRTVVDINGVKSRPFYLNDGLSQGSAISPLLFLLFISDITEHIKDGETEPLQAYSPMTGKFGLQAPGIKKKRSRKCKQTSMASVSSQRNRKWC